MASIFPSTNSTNGLRAFPPVEIKVVIVGCEPVLLQHGIKSLI